MTEQSGLLKGLARGENGRLFKLDLTTGEPNTGKPTNLDVIIDAALTDSTDPTHQDKINNVKPNIEEYIKTSEIKADEIKSFLEKYSDPKNITTKDVSIFANMIKEIQNLNANSGNSLAESFKNDNKTLLQNNLSESKATLTEGVPTTVSKKPFRGGQTGGTVGMFESLKSVFRIDEYWKKNATHSYLASTALKKYKDITNELFDKKYGTEHKIELLKAKLLEKQITHNFKDDDIRQIIIMSPGFYSSKEEDKEKAVDIASDFMKHLIQTGKQAVEVKGLTKIYTEFRNNNKITELQNAYSEYNKVTMKHIMEKFEYNLKKAIDFIKYYISTVNTGLSEKYSKDDPNTVKSKLDEIVKKAFVTDLNNYDFINDQIKTFEHNTNSSDYPDDIVSDPFGIDTNELSGLSFALVKIFNFLKGVLTVPVGFSGAVIVMTIGIAELAVKPGLLAVDLTASMIAALFQNIKDAKVVPTSDNFVDIAKLPGGSKKTRHRKKNTKKNKKHKRRNTNRK